MPGRVGKDPCEIKTQNFLKRLFELSLGGGGVAENVNGVKLGRGLPCLPHTGHCMLLFQCPTLKRRNAS